MHYDSQLINYRMTTVLITRTYNKTYESGMM